MSDLGQGRLLGLGAAPGGLALITVKGLRSPRATPVVAYSAGPEKR